MLAQDVLGDEEKMCKEQQRRKLVNRKLQNGAYTMTMGSAKYVVDENGDNLQGRRSHETENQNHQNQYNPKIINYHPTEYNAVTPPKQHTRSFLHQMLGLSPSYP